MTCIAILNILTYIHLSMFFVFFFLLVLKIFFIYISDYWFIWLDICMNFFIYTFNFFIKQPVYSGFFNKKKLWSAREAAILKDITCKVYIGREIHENSK